MTLAIDRRADHWQQRIAVIDHATGETTSYHTLSQTANGMTHALADAGVDPGDSVAVLARNRPAYLALFYATRHLDATLAPISHRLPEATVTTLLDRIDPTLTIVEDAVGDGVPGTHSTTPIPTPDPTPDPVNPGIDTRDSPRFYLHTGGTTGTPKLVAIPGRQVEWNCITEAAAWGLGHTTVAPILLPMFHTGGWLLLTLPTLYVGGRVVLDRAFDPGGALAMIEEYGATQVFGVAAVFEAMATHDDFESTDFSSVNWFMSGGGPTPETVMAAYRDRGETFVQGYGLTEGGPNNLYVDPTRADAHDKSDRVGRPFPDCRVRIVDTDGTTVATGVVGELEVAGAVTATGYLETADGTFDGEWVSTGDLAERDADGDIAIVGRTDNMFVSGGENVYPEPIEATLETHPDVDAVGVVPIPHDRWGQVPKAIVVGDIDESTLESVSRNELAAHQRPQEYVFVDDLPRSGPGKLDRDTLETEYGQ